MAFFKCYGMALVNLPDGLEYIGNDAFSYCSNMRYAIYIPASVKEIGHHAFYKCDENMDFYMGAKDENAVVLGGRWQPRNDNKFKSKAPLWAQPRTACDEYNNGRYAEDEKAAAEAEASQGNTQSSPSGDMNSTVMMVIIIVFFIPGFLYIGLQVIRNIFKEDFLMTKKGKEKLRKLKEEKERIHKAYLESADDEIQEETQEGGENNE